MLYPEEGITKLDLARYYAEIEAWALPQLAHRPLNLLRCPTGLGGERVFQKHAGAGMPKQVGRLEIDGETHLAIEDLAGLVALVQLGVLEIHPWGSTLNHIEEPDRITFDLDPDTGLPSSRDCATPPRRSKSATCSPASAFAALPSPPAARACTSWPH